MTPIAIYRQVRAKRHVKRCRSQNWDAFEQRFEPLLAPDHGHLWDTVDVPKDAEVQYWWTVLDCDGRLYAAPGFRFVNRYAYVRCAKPWGTQDRDTWYLCD